MQSLALVPSGSSTAADASQLKPVFGAHVTEQGVSYTAWAPNCRSVEAAITQYESGEPRLVPMSRGEDGLFHANDPKGRAGDFYKFRLDGGDSFPDPGSRAQVEDVHGAAIVVDPSAYSWGDGAWVRPPFRELVIYEMHIGAFTPEGAFRAAIEKLPYLRELGVTAIEIMPIADFPGSRNWGYDGVLIYAPARPYGRPDDLRALVDAAHQHGLAVILDVVYNHFGPDGNYLSKYSSSFFSSKHHTPWGSALNFDDEGAAHVRRFFVGNVIYWMEEFHIDGFRLDATHAIIDTSEPHILAEIASAVHARGGYVVAEDERNEVRLLSSREERGYELDGVWADDFHHVARVGQTGQREAYFASFRGTLDELIDTLRHGWLYRGQRARADGEKRGTECRRLPPSKFVHCITNHDQVGNRAFGDRLHDAISPEGYRALSMLLCLTPYTPMLYMGQEWAASTPFLYFTDHNSELGPLVTEGRRREFSEFPGFGDRADLQAIPDPQSEQTFQRSKLIWEEREKKGHAETLTLYRECLHLRRSSPAFRPESREGWTVEELSIGVGAMRFEDAGGSYLLLINQTGAHQGALSREPSAAAGAPWELVLSSNDERFGGPGSGFDAEEQRCCFKTAEVVLLRSRGKSPPG